jgi:hypothetical protein
MKRTGVVSWSVARPPRARLASQSGARGLTMGASGRASNQGRSTGLVGGHRRRPCGESPRLAELEGKVA